MDALRRPAAVAAAVLQLVFLLAAAAPNMAWCHRPGGETILEFEVAAGACPYVCAPAPAASATFRPSHPKHNEIDSEAGRSSDSMRSPLNAAPALQAAVAARPLVLPHPAAPRSGLHQARPERDSGPSRAASLRC